MQRIAAAVSEVARNAFVHAGGGIVEFLVTNDDRQALPHPGFDNGYGIRVTSTVETVSQQRSA